MKSRICKIFWALGIATQGYSLFVFSLNVLEPTLYSFSVIQADSASLPNRDQQCEWKAWGGISQLRECLQIPLLALSSECSCSGLEHPASLVLFDLSYAPCSTNPVHLVLNLGLSFDSLLWSPQTIICGVAVSHPFALPRPWVSAYWVSTNGRVVWMSVSEYLPTPTCLW